MVEAGEFYKLNLDPETGLPIIWGACSDETKPEKTFSLRIEAVNDIAQWQEV